MTVEEADSVPRACPGVYWEDEYRVPPRAFRTGVPVFLGFTEKGDCGQAQLVARYSHFTSQFGTSPKGAFLEAAVRGFFENEGRFCYVVRLNQDVALEDSLGSALTALVALEEIDLVCAPDLMTAADPVGLQQMVLDHCDQAANRFAILDSLPGAALADALEKQWRVLTGKNAALYYPWVRVSDGAESRAVPPCGHVAGIYARTDEQVGVFKAPANETVEGVLDLETSLTSAQQGSADPHGVVNCLRAFPGRGIRVWGARTISGQHEWKYVNVRRLFLTISRWAEEFMADVVMEPNTTELQGRIRRELNDYLYKLYRSGALQGASPDEAYYLRCNSRTTSATDMESGRVVAEIGFAPVVPNEFIVVRLIHESGGITLAGPGEPAS